MRGWLKLPPSWHVKLEVAMLARVRVELVGQGSRVSYHSTEGRSPTPTWPRCKAWRPCHSTQVLHRHSPCERSSRRSRSAVAHVRDVSPQITAMGLSSLCSAPSPSGRSIATASWPCLWPHAGLIFALMRGRLLAPSLVQYCLVEAVSGSPVSACCQQVAFFCPPPCPLGVLCSWCASRDLLTRVWLVELGVAMLALLRVGLDAGAILKHRVSL